jgi:hypothetical protein
VVAVMMRVISGVVGLSTEATMQLPGWEAEVWRSVGASFDDQVAVRDAQLRTASAFGRLVHDSVVGDAEMARVLDVDRSRISQRVSEHSLYAFDGPTGRCSPRWQVVNGRPLQGLGTVLTALDPALHPRTVDHWMTTPNDGLLVRGEPTSPVDWLATGGSPDITAGLAAEL